jgi:hypothetical protein
MKPTPQVKPSKNQPRRLPLTDHNFQTTLEAGPATAGHEAKISAPRPLWRMSADLFRLNAAPEFVREFVAFVLIGAVSAWSIAIAMHAATRLVRGY